MKRIGMIFAMLVLTLSLFCGCGMRKKPMETVPTRATAPTVPATVAPTVPATETVPHTSAPMEETGIIGSEEPTDSARANTAPHSGANTRSRMR